MKAIRGKARVAPIVFLVSSAAVLLAAGAARGVEPRVAGLHDLVVIKPDTHRAGRPGVLLETSESGYLTAEIPPTIHIHRFYYSGDREFQGPLLEGGPTLIVAGHPRTGQRTYAEVALPPGVPRIAHNRKGITYAYDDRRVAIHFAADGTHGVKVKYHSGVGLTRRLHAVREHAVASLARPFQQSPTVASIHDTMSEGKQLLVGTRDALDSLTATVIDSVKALGGSVPGVAALKSYADDGPARAYQQAIERAQRERDRASLDRVPSIR